MKVASTLFSVVSTGLLSRGIAPTQDCAHTGLRPHGIAPTLDCAKAGLHPHSIAPTRDCAHIISPTRDCTHAGLRPHGIAPTLDCVHAGLHPCSCLSLSLFPPRMSLFHSHPCPPLSVASLLSPTPVSLPIFLSLFLLPQRETDFSYRL